MFGGGGPCGVVAIGRDPTDFSYMNRKTATAAATEPQSPKITEAGDDAGRPSAFDRRRGPGRRRTDYRRDAEDGHMNEEQLEFIKAVDEYKRANGKPFPTWTEILDLVLYLGYRKVAPIGEFRLTKSRDAAAEPDGE